MIDLNLLQVRSDPSLIFTANTPDRKGLAFKTYTIDIPNNSHNNAILEGLFSINAYLPVVFDAQYKVDNHLFIGTLTVDSINEVSAKATFVSGNGYLWNKMGTVRMRDLNWSAYDIQLNKANVIASESGGGFMLFDLVDRGAFKNERAIDIADRYPAINLKKLLVELFGKFDTFVTFEELLTTLSDKYLLFTQSSEVRNSSEWLQDSVFEAEAIVPTEYTDSGLNTQPVFEVYEKLQFPTEKRDGGSNYDDATHEYTVPETGTYSFKCDYYLYFERPSTATVSGVSASLRLFKNGVAVAVQTIDVSDLSGTDASLIRQGTYNSSPVEYQAGDVISMYIYYAGSITSTSSWIVRATQNTDTTGFLNKFYVTPSRWYGAGSTIEVNKIMPDMTVLEFIRAVLNDFNLDVFYNDLTGQALICSGKDMSVAGSLALFNWGQDIQQQADVLLQFKHDKVRVPDDYLIKFIGQTSDEAVINMASARTYIGSCVRLFNNSTTHIPILWQSGDPSDWQQTDTPPAQQTSAALRFVQRIPNISASYKLSYGGIVGNNEETISSVLQLRDIDYRTLHLYDKSLQDVIISGQAVNIAVDKLADMTYFRRPLEVIDFTRGRQIITGWLLEAVTSDGIMFSVKVRTASTNDIDITQTSRPVVDLRANTTSAGGGGTGQTFTPTPLPLDIWQSSISGQVSGLTEKTIPANADNFIIDDSADGNKKKRLTWANIKTTLSYIFYGAFADQFNATTAKNTLVNNDVFIIEDSANAYQKRSIKWSSIRTVLDNFYYGAIQGQFNATPDKTSIMNNDIFIIEDSENSFNKKKISLSVIKNFFDNIYGYWIKVTNGLKTSQNIAINDDPSLSVVAKIKGKSAYQQTLDVEDVDQTNATIRSTCFSSSGTSQAPVPIAFRRKTSGTPVNGIGMNIPFILPNSDGTDITCANILIQFTTATAGAEVAQWSVIVNTLQRIELTDGVFRVVNIDQQIDSDRAYYLGDKSTDGSWRIIRSSNNLLMQRRESGTWVTKQTITS